MRVITGTARGRKLVTPQGKEVRPTTDMVKEAIFSILTNDVPGSKVLDLFAGSGQLGIEAVSRGAVSAVFVDEKRESINCIKENLKNTGLSPQCSIVMTDSIGYLRRESQKFNIIILDPPYKQGIIDEVLPLALEHLEPNGVVVCETDVKEVLPEGNEDFKIFREYKYGKIKLTVYRDTRI